MNDIQQLIEQAKAIMTCPVCGRHYESDEIEFKGFMDRTYVLQTNCDKKHPPIFTTWITSYGPIQINQKVVPIDSDNIIDLHSALAVFDGNFRALWPSRKTKERE